MRFILLLLVSFLVSPLLLASEFPTGNLKGVGFIVEKNNQKITEKNLHSYSSSATIVKLSDGRYQFTVAANLQVASNSPVKVEKRMDIYRVLWTSKTTGKLLNSNSEFKDDKGSFAIGNGRLVIKTWVARNQVWETHFYLLRK